MIRFMALTSLLTAGVTVGFVGQVAADSQMISVDSFAELYGHVLESGEDAIPQSLIVMDDDDTLTMMSCPDQSDLAACQYLGGPAWYDWQSQLLETQSPYRIANSQDELLAINTLLLAMNNMVFVESLIPEVLGGLSQQGSKLLVLTARGSATASATTRQLASLHVGDDSDSQASFLSLISQNALPGLASGAASIASPFQSSNCEQQRPVSYEQGVMFVAGQDKGRMLHCLLRLTDSDAIKYVYFIDDTLANVEAVHEAFKNDATYQVLAMHYTALAAHKAALTKGDKAEHYQRNATQRWLAIKSALDSNLQNPAATQSLSN